VFSGEFVRLRSHPSEEHDQPAVTGQDTRLLNRKPTHDPEGGPQYPPRCPMVMTQQLDGDDEPSQHQNGEFSAG
jgi:hypothetical protein